MPRLSACGWILYFRLWRLILARKGSNLKPKLIGGFSALALICGLAMAPLTSQAESSKGPRNDGDFPKGLQGNVRHGQAVFEDNCLRCHGLHGDGQGRDAATLDLKPPSFQTDSFRAEFGRRAIFTSTALGKLGTHMPTWLKHMDDQDVADVSEYVYQHFVTRQLAPVNP